MTVYNGSKHLREAIDSILGQSWVDFEFIIVDDGSSDDSPLIIASYTDPRIVRINAPHRGLVMALNAGLAQARGRYVARMDADDRARPERLMAQYTYMEAHPKIDILCSDIAIINGEGRRSGHQRQSNLNNDLLREGLLFRRTIKPVIHPSVMMRRNVPEQLDGYRAFDSAEDHDFWLRAIDEFRFARLGEILLDYRIHDGGISRAKGSKQATASAMSAVGYLVRKATGIDIFDSDREVFLEIAEELRGELEQQVLVPAFAFRSARLKMLTGNWWLGCRDMVLALIRHGSHALPGAASIGTSRIIERTVVKLSASLNPPSKDVDISNSASSRSTTSKNG